VCWDGIIFKDLAYALEDKFGMVMHGDGRKFLRLTTVHPESKGFGSREPKPSSTID